MLDGPVFYLNASGLRTSASGFEASYGSMIDSLAPLLVDQLTAMGFDAHAPPRHAVRDRGGWQLGDDQRDPGGADRARQRPSLRSRQLYDPRPTARVRCATLAPGTEKRNPPRWPTKLTLKGDLLEASFEGHLDVGESLQLSGQAELSTPSVRRGARWFGVPVPSSEGLNAATIKGQINWARHTLAFEDG